MWNGLLSMAFLLPLVFVQQPQPYRPLPEIKKDELNRPNYIVTTKNKDDFRKYDVVPVGQFVGVVLPVQLGTSYVWRLEESDKNVFRWINEKKDGKPDLRAMSPDFQGHSTGNLGRADALQIFRFEVKEPAKDTPIRFRLVSSVDGRPSETTFEARVTSKKL